MTVFVHRLPRSSWRVFQRISKGLRILIAGCIASSWTGPIAAQDSADKDYAAELPRIPALEPHAARASFEILPGFELELVACEPLVTDPVAFAFDAHGRLFVVEMRDYSEQEHDRLGRVALLEDTDGDGRMDRRTDFVTGLSWPTAVWPWRDGVLVAEPPRITWYRDTDGDGRSDASEDWFTGFHRSNVQGLVNSLRWGIDGWIHGATSSSGADVMQLAAPSDRASSPVALRRRDFAIDPLTKALRPESGGGQHGMSFNRWGDKFVTSNSDHLQQVVDLDAWLESHPTPVPFPPIRRSIATDGPQAEVFRVSPIEPWRIVRTRLRVQGIVPGPVEGGGRPAGYFTGATGTWIVDREMGFGDPAYDTALVCDVGSNLVHRKRLIDRGLFWQAERIDAQTELLRSRDIWFRPVQLGDGPDGAIYIADMYREVIEHPKSLPPVIKRHLDLTSGRDRGRIWRLRRTGMPADTAPPVGELSGSALVATLASPIAWRRLTASQRLVELYGENRSRLAPDVRDALWASMHPPAPPHVRVLALHVADRLNALSPGRMLGLLQQEQHPRVIEHALKITRNRGWPSQEPAGWSPAFGRIALESPRVQLELALTVADLPPSLRLATLERVATAATDPLVQSCTVAAAGDAVGPLLTALADQVPEQRLEQWIGLAIDALYRSASENEKVRRQLVQNLDPASGRAAWAWLRSASRLGDAAITGLLAAMPDSVRQNVQREIRHRLEQRPIAPNDWPLIHWLPAEAIEQLAARWLRPEVALELQMALVDALRSRREPAIGRLLVDRLPAMTPALREAALQAIVQRRSWADALLQRIESAKVPVSLVSAAQRESIRQLGDADWQSRVDAVFGAVNRDRASLIERYARAIAEQESPQPERGRDVFRQSCAPCHRLDGFGNDVGAGLKELNSKTPRQLLEAILDPDREIDPRFLSYTVLTEDDRVLTGVVRDETANQITLLESGGKQHTLSRDSVVQITSSGRSLMPTGLEEQISPDRMADLIAYLRTH